MQDASTHGGRAPLVAAGGAQIPALGLGTWQLTGPDCRDRVADALAAGYRHVDTAHAYGNHAEVGEGLRRSGVPREEVFLTTKLGVDDLRPESVRVRTEESLRDLRVEVLDLLLIHWPSPVVPLEQTLGAMLDLREQGRVRHLGVSNFTPSDLERAAAVAPLVCNQVEYHPLLSQERVLDAARARGMALVAYSPLAHGAVMQCAPLVEIGRAHDRSAAQVALRWLLQQEGVVAIPKASRREHLEQNLAVFDFALDAEEMRRVGVLTARGLRTVDPPFAPDWERDAQSPG